MSTEFASFLSTYSENRIIKPVLTYQTFFLPHFCLFWKTTQTSCPVLVLKSWVDFVYRSLFTGSEKGFDLLEIKFVFLTPIKERHFTVRTYFI